MIVEPDFVSEAPELEPARPPDPRRRRWRVMATAGSLGGLVVLTDAMIGGPLMRHGPAHSLGGLILIVGALLLLSGILTGFRRAWHRNLRRDTDRAITHLGAWTRRFLRGRRPMVGSPPMRLGERIALLAGLLLTTLDVVLTSLLLKDVFPEPPYRFDALGVLSPAAADWSFYVVVAGFKAVLEVWFGVIDRVKLEAEGQRGLGWSATRWFVLGGASAFDAVLAASRGLLLAEQGLDGAAVTVSNIVFIGFGIAVPWVAAMTGALLVPAAEPILARLSPLSLLAAGLRLSAVAMVWLVALAIGVPFLLGLAALGLATAAWFAIEDGLGVVMGHDVTPTGVDGPPPDGLVPAVPARARGLR